MGKRKQFSYSVRSKILESEDPYNLGKQLGMPRSTICDLLRRDTAQLKCRGGARSKRIKIQPIHLEALERWIEEKPDLTLRNLSGKLLCDFNLDVTPQCIAEHLEGMCYSLKQCRSELDGVNNALNKFKRKEYAEKYMELIGNGYVPVFEDEANFNVHCKRNNGRAKIGSRAHVKVSNSRGANLHCIAAISPSSLIFFESRRGSLKSEDFRPYIWKIVDSILEKGIRKAVIIIDNAPSHCKAEEQLEAKLSSVSRQVFDDILLLRLAPYSHSLNPIENYWSSFKSKVKDIMREKREEINNDAIRQDGESLSSKRMRILEETSQNAATDSAKIETINACFNHLFTHLPKALREEDMPIGE